jgi:hypothetical protein
VWVFNKKDKLTNFFAFSDLPASELEEVVPASGIGSSTEVVSDWLASKLRLLAIG